MNGPASVSPPIKVVHLCNLPYKCGWEEIEEKLDGYVIEQHHIFNNQALLQFENSDLAHEFVLLSNGYIYIKGSKVQVQLSKFPALNSSSLVLFSDRVHPSPVICIQIKYLRVYISIFDIYDECSKYGNVKKIICFTKDNGKFALVQMANAEEAALALTNLHNSTNHRACYQMHVQYSKNTNLQVKVNNTRTFDFTLPRAIEQFNKMKESNDTKLPFFEPEPNPSISQVFNQWGPVTFDSANPEVLCITNLDESKSACLPIRNLFEQYGHVHYVKIIEKNMRTAFIQMVTGFFARTATLFLQECPFMGRKLQISFSGHNDIIPPAENERSDLYADYGPGPSDYPIEFCQNIYFPSRFVHIREPIEAKYLVAATHDQSIVKIYDENNVVEFKRIEDAVDFIAAFNMLDFMGTQTMLSFSRPPSK